MKLSPRHYIITNHINSILICYSCVLCWYVRLIQPDDIFGRFVYAQAENINDSCDVITQCLKGNLIKRRHGLLAWYKNLRVTQAPGMPGTLSPPSRVNDPDMHYGTCVTHVTWCMPGSLTSGFLCSRWRGKHSRCLRKFHVSGKRAIDQTQMRLGPRGDSL